MDFLFIAGTDSQISTRLLVGGHGPGQPVYWVQAGIQGSASPSTPTCYHILAQGAMA